MSVQYIKLNLYELIYKWGWSSQYCSIFQIKTQDKQKHSYIINKDIIKLEIKNIIAYENVLIKNVNVIIIEVVSKDQYTNSILYS